MDLPYLNRIKKISALILITVCLTNCNHKKELNQWDEVRIDPKISKDSIYKQLDKQEEIFSAFEDHDSLMKRTSDVAYFSGEKINLKDDKFSKLNNCRAYFFHSDTLSVNIGIGDSFGGHGFIITYKNNKFYTEPYFSTDVIIEGEVEPTYKIVYQKLTLDKPDYVIGDSLYGKIDFKSIEIDKEKIKTEHFGKGYFRTKVVKR